MSLSQQGTVWLFCFIWYKSLFMNSYGQWEILFVKIDNQVWNRRKSAKTAIFCTRPVVIVRTIMLIFIKIIKLCVNECRVLFCRFRQLFPRVCQFRLNHCNSRPKSYRDLLSAATWRRLSRYLITSFLARNYIGKRSIYREEVNLQNGAFWSVHDIVLPDRFHRLLPTFIFIF